MNADFRETPLLVREPMDDRMDAIADLGVPNRALGSVRVPSGRIVIAFVSDSALLYDLFAHHWARAPAGQEPDVTLYVLAGQPRSYGLDDTWEGARWWSPATKTMVVFGGGSYRLVKLCIRGVCSAVSGDDIMFLHGCTLCLGEGSDTRGIVITGSSGAGKTTLVAKLLERPEYPVTVVNDDWGAVSLGSGQLVNTGERRLHMKSSSVLALRPGFFASAPRRSYSFDSSEPDATTRLLVSPERVYGTRWNTGGTVIAHVAVIVREAPGWVPPHEKQEAARALRWGGYSAYYQRNEAFFNGSLILSTAGEQMREEQHYQRLLKRVSLSWLNNCGTPDELMRSFMAAVGKTG